MSNNRAYIFNAGPSVMPYSALENSSKAVLNYNNLGISLVELSHRGKDFEKIHNESINNWKEVFSIPSEYEVLYMQGGAILQFAMIPMNFLKSGSVAHYVDTGTWSSKALKEAKNVGNAQVVASSSDKSYTYIPKNIPDEKQ